MFDQAPTRAPRRSDTRVAFGAGCRTRQECRVYVGRVLGLLIGLSVFLLASVEAQVINVQLQAQPGQRDVRLPLGAALPDGNEVRVGTFAAGVDVEAQTDDLVALQGAWREFGRTTVRTLSGQGGRFSATLTGDGEGFVGERLYVWVFKTSSNGPVNGTLSNVEAHGLFAREDGWTFPASTLPPSNSITVTSSAADAFLVGTGTADSLVLAESSTASPPLLYQDWQETAFSEATPLSEQDPEDNPDGDDLNNAMEYLTGNDPEAPNTLPFELSQSATELILSYPRVRAIPEGTEIIESSTDLLGWKEAGFTTSKASIDEARDLVTVIVPTDVDRGFVRIRVGAE